MSILRLASHWPPLLLCGLLLVPITAVSEEADWYPSRYGADDTLGALNNLSSV